MGQTGSMPNLKSKNIEIKESDFNIRKYEQFIKYFNLSKAFEILLLKVLKYLL